MDSGEANAKPTAICLVRAEVSGPNAPRHAMEVQRHAERLGYLHLYTVRPPADAADPVGYALGLAASLNVDAIVVYDLETVGNSPSRVCDMFDLETVCPPATWAVTLPGFADPEHSHPEQPLTVASAQQIMQEHVNCRAVECPRKASAYSCLVRAGKIVPPVDSPRERAAARGLRFRPRRTNDCPLPDGVNLETLLDVLSGLADYASTGNR
ncbi:hypothetical protein B7C42_02647 [Nocardia cerradoensis]|uniref:Uncharacterized protein n=2 Tax=Nocardia cerradoensis TaxID=85688 RepID=A0A231H9P5_9NOCA|nr:hypothetical protein B7C42_02647 [Nocardia cerradoensis]